MELILSFIGVITLILRLQQRKKGILAPPNRFNCGDVQKVQEVVVVYFLHLLLSIFVYFPFIYLSYYFRFHDGGNGLVLPSKFGLRLREEGEEVSGLCDGGFLDLELPGFLEEEEFLDFVEEGRGWLLWRIIC